jgi:PAS domain S-box-containing protein
LQRAKATAAFGYVLKPFEERELRVAIEMALYKHGSEQRLKERERWLAATLNSIREAVITANERGQVALVNEAAEELSGWTQGDAWGKPLTQVLRIEDASGRLVTARATRQANRAGHGVNLGNHVLVRKGGARTPVDCTITPIRDERGRLSGTVAVVRDLSELKDAETALSDSEDRYNVLLEASVDGILLVQLDGTIVDCNSTMAETMGMSREEVVGLSLRELSIIPTDLMPQHSEFLARLSRGEQFPPFEMSFSDHAGRRRILEMSAAPLKRRGRVYAIQIIGHSVGPSSSGRD